MVYPLRPKQRRLFSLLMFVCFWIESVCTWVCVFFLFYREEGMVVKCNERLGGCLSNDQGIVKAQSSFERMPKKGMTGIILRNLAHAGHQMSSTVAFWHFVGDKINRSTKFQRNLVTCIFHQPTPSEISILLELCTCNRMYKLRYTNHSITNMFCEGIPQIAVMKHVDLPFLKKSFDSASMEVP